jgi:phosphosulfolactate phosphohydrolase-like enzyme
MEDAFVLTDSLEQAEGKVRFAGPAWLRANEGGKRAIVHVSPLAEMMTAAMPRAAVYVACLRNLEATADALARRHARVAILGAGERGEVCTEDQMAAAWLAARLQVRGFEIEGHDTAQELARWGQPDVSLVGWSRSAERLRARGRAADVDFVLGHLDDLNVVATYSGGEVRNPATAPPPVDDEDERPTPAWGTTLPILGH